MLNAHELSCTDPLDRLPFATITGHVLPDKLNAPTVVTAWHRS